MKQTTIHIYLDESGSFHNKKCNYFVIGGYCRWTTKTPKSLFLRFENKYKKNVGNKEFKAQSIGFEYTIEFFNEFINKQFLPIAIIAIKKNCKFKIKEDYIYNYLVKLLIKQVTKRILVENEIYNCELIISCDNRSQKIESKKSLECYLNSESICWNMNICKNKKIRKISVNYFDSKKSTNIRISDFISNYTYNYINKHNEWSQIKNKYYVFDIFPSYKR